jgi:hypothetical protein
MPNLRHPERIASVRDRFVLDLHDKAATRQRIAVVTHYRWKWFSMAQHQTTNAFEADSVGTDPSSSSAGLKQLFDLYTDYRAKVEESVRRIRKQDSQPRFAVETIDEFRRFWQQLGRRDQAIWEERLRRPRVSRGSALCSVFSLS